MVDKVVLVNLSANRNVSRSGLGSHKNSLALQTIRAGLEAEGISDIVCLPESPIEWRLKEKDRYDKFDNLFKEVASPEEDVVFALSAVGESYTNLQVACITLRNDYPNATIVAGGMAFSNQDIRRKDGTKVRDSLQMPLQGGFVDAVVLGHAQPFIDFIVKNDGQLGFEAPGWYEWQDGVVGSGRGKYPKLPTGVIPITVDRREVDPAVYGQKSVKYIELLLEESCRNACDFCSNKATRAGPGLQSEPDWELILKGNYIWVSIVDSNPLDSHDSMEAYSRQFLAGTKVNEKAWFNIYLDPATLREEAGVREVINFCKHHNIASLFMGRDAISGHEAELLGSRYRGKIRTEDELEAEKEGIARLIEYSSETRMEELFVSYIFLPWQTREGMLAMVDEMEMFEKMSNKTLVRYKRGPLSPNPATRIRKEHIDEILSPEFIAGPEYMNTTSWNPDIGCGVDFLDLLWYYPAGLKFRKEKEFIGPVLSPLHHMRLGINEAFDGMFRDTAERKKEAFANFEECMLKGYASHKVV